MPVRPATPGWIRTPEAGVDSWTTRAASRYPSRMTGAPVTSPGNRCSWRTASRLAAPWIFAAAVSAPGPVAAAHAGVWSTDANDSLVGRSQVYIARYEDTLLDIARRFSMGLAELQLANPEVDIWLPGEGAAIRLPSRFVLPDAPRSGLVVNVAEMRVYFYPRDGSVVRTWPISIGRVGWETPLGETRIVRKKAYPTWYPPESIREEAAMEGNPLPPGRRSRTRQSARFPCAVSRISGIPDSRDQQAVQHRHARQPWMYPHVSRTHRGAVRDRGAGNARHAGAPGRQGGMGGGRAVS